MNAQEAVKRIGITISPLTDRFLVGIKEKPKKGQNYECFLEKIDMTQELLAVLMDYLKNGEEKWNFSDSKGNTYSLRIVKEDGEKQKIEVKK